MTNWLATAPYTLILLTLLAGSDLFAQSPARSPAGSSRPASMQVVELGQADSASRTAHDFVVVGAVRRSAVYRSAEVRLPLSLLIRQAGGLDPSASGAVRILHGHRVRIQVSYPAAADEVVLAGEVVVVPPSAARAERTTAPVFNSSPTIPVACLGLTDRPVVLPLDRRIRTLALLQEQLLQPPLVHAHARVLLPAANLTEGVQELVPGSVIVFDPRTIDRQALHTALAREPLPPPVLLDSHPVVQPVSGVVSAPQQPDVQFVDPPPSLSTADAPPLLLAPFESGAEPAPAANELLSARTPPSSSGSDAARSAEARPTVTAPSQGSSARFPSQQQANEATSSAEPSWAFADPTLERRSPGTDSLVTGDTIANAPLPPGPTQSSGDAAHSEAASQGGPYWWVLKIVGLASVIGLLAGAGWWQRSRLTDVLRSVSQTRRLRRIQRKIVLQGKVSFADADLALIEKPPVILRTPPLHGEVVAHQKLQIDEAHQALGAPHFARRPQRHSPRTTRVIDERQLRDQLRRMLPESAPPGGPAPIDRMTDISPPAESQTVTVAGEYDVVEPEEGTPPVKGPGLLERALRSHAKGALE